MKKILSGMLFIFTFSANAQTVTTTLTDSLLTSGWIKVYNEGLMGYLDDTGQEILPAVYDEIGSFEDYCDNMALVRKGDLYGLVDIHGNVVADVQYEEIGRYGAYKPGWILVKRDGLYGFMDCSGEEVVPPAYTEIETKSDTLKTD